MTKEIVLRIPSEDIDIRPGKYNTKITIKNTSDILLELDGNTMLKSSGKLFFLSEEEMGFISKHNIFIESIDSELHLNSRLCSVIKDDPESIKYREQAQIAYEEDKKIAEEQQLFTKQLKDRVTILEQKVATLLLQRESKSGEI